ncbi:hypothetical protein [Rhizobium leguminosarum]|jgi:hypothetical protein|nr:hypothetical protein [Rhizobium leguminosarum]MBB4342115.1 hypothetical protein [Rhizobium leguminosarum]MBB6294739.1 hypothetical protein [Rhizobium leguminosarum]
MLVWISDRLWKVSEWFIAAASWCKAASIAVLVYRLRRKENRR